MASPKTKSRNSFRRATPAEVKAIAKAAREAGAWRVEVGCEGSITLEFERPVDERVSACGFDLSSTDPDPYNEE